MPPRRHDREETLLATTVGVAFAFVLTLLFSLETRGKELVPQLTLVEQPA